MRKELAQSAQQSSAEIEHLKHQNTVLETRAFEAEQKVTLLLDQVETSVVNYRRQSQQVHANGVLGHHRQLSSTSTTGAGSRPRGDSMSESNYGGLENSRNSMALDSLASELDALRSHWETTAKNYRLSSQFDFEKTPTISSHGELSDSLANWRKRLDQEEAEAGASTGGDGDDQAVLQASGQTI
jgi:hypothetical protein